MCDNYDYYSRHSTQSPSELRVLERCQQGASLIVVSAQNIIKSVKIQTTGSDAEAKAEEDVPLFCTCAPHIAQGLASWIDKLILSVKEQCLTALSWTE